MLEERLEQDIKSALIARDAERVSTLRTLKSVFLNEKVASGTRDQALPDEVAIRLLAKEAKKRQESADLYTQGGSPERAEKELAEKAVIETYLPAQLSDDDLKSVITSVVNELGPDAGMGQIIGEVKTRTAGSADGSVIARLVKEALA